MALTAKIDYTKYTDAIRTIEAHTEGEYCRVALDCPETEGNTMIERKHYLEEHYDYLRTALMFEPRGHHDMSVLSLLSLAIRKLISAYSSWTVADTSTCAVTAQSVL